MIGDIVIEQPLFFKMSRKALAEGICSEKYIYMNETNKRNPSAYILSDLSERLDLDFFGYYPYLDYKNKKSIRTP